MWTNGCCSDCKIALISLNVHVGLIHNKFATCLAIAGDDIDVPEKKSYALSFIATDE